MKLLMDVCRLLSCIVLLQTMLCGGVTDFKRKSIKMGKPAKLSCRTPAHTAKGELIKAGPVWKIPSNIVNSQRSVISGPKLVKIPKGGKYEWRNDIIINESKIDDSGLYQCMYSIKDTVMVEEPSTTDSINWFKYFVSEDRIVKRMYLFVYDDKNLLTNTPDHIKISKGSDLVIPCRMTTKDADQVHLKRIPSTIELPPRITYEPAIGYVIYNATYSDAGMWKCVAKNNNIETSRSMIVQVEFPFQTFRIVKMYVLPSKRVMINSTVIIHCEAECKIGARVKFHWKYLTSSKSSKLLPTYGKVKMGERRNFNRYAQSLPLRPKEGYEFWWSRVEIENVELSDTGMYFCSVQSKSKNKTKVAEVQVMDTQYLYMIREPEYVNKDGTNKSGNIFKAVKGYSTALDFEVAAFPSPAFQWLHNDQPLEGGDFSIQMTENTKDTTFVISLIFNETKYENAGKYKLIVENGSGKNNFTFYVNVSEPSEPIIAEFHNTRIDLKVGQNALLDCKVSGSPTPFIQWYHGDKIIQNGTSKYSLLRVTPDSAGNYTCFATNNLGRKHRSLQVRVNDPKTGFTFGFAIGISVLIVLLISLTSILFYKIKKFKETKKKMELAQRYLVPILDPTQMTIKEQAGRLAYDSKKWEIPRDRLRLGKTIGRGAFGRVVQATAFDVDKFSSCKTVAIKMLNVGSRSCEYNALMSELKILIHIGPHLNIVNLFGACTTKDGPPMVIVEYCRFGNLSNYLRRMRDHYIERNQKKRTESKSDESNVDVDECKRYSGAESDIIDKTSISGESAFVDCGSESRCWDKSNRSSTSSSISASFALLSRDDDELLTKTRLSSSESLNSGRASIKKNNCNDEVGTYNEKQHLNVADLLSYSVQVARGMEFLSSKMCIHRDLAARNVLLTDYQVVKICDFGLARDIYNHPDYVRRGEARLPWKWMALESIFDEIYSTKSDVWSFGILLWEIFSLGGSPYPGIQMNGDFCDKLKSGVRMKKPEYAPDQIYSAMLACWVNNPDERPTFTRLAEEISDLLQNESENDYLDMLRIFEQNYESMPVRGVSKVDQPPETFEEMKISKMQQKHHTMVTAVEYADVDAKSIAALSHSNDVQTEVVNFGGKCVSSEDNNTVYAGIGYKNGTSNGQSRPITDGTYNIDEPRDDDKRMMKSQKSTSLDSCSVTSASENPPSYSTVITIAK